ncbi:MAG: ABC transporter substrate-binding protein [Alphaproteobacteria bacterium]|nr:ABC transporter substrate-binding protein [Alphaproteobacteria bacterium]MCB9931573.1 ABC transporter substrate-binding protein [Alphaproteobacteria bacterium]
MLGRSGQRPCRKRGWGIAAAIGAIALASLASAAPALAQKQGGVLRVYNSSNPPSLSIHEEGTIATVMPMMAVFNNLVLSDQSKPKSSIDTVVPDLAESWSYDDSQTNLTFKLRQGVKWHDGQPFTAKDVKCTWDWVSGLAKSGFRKNPRKVWFDNLKEITVDNDYEVTFHLNDPQPSLLTLLASGHSPVYPCHVPAKTMRTAPIGTGPFMFKDFQSNASIRVERNPNYWKAGMPYLDAIQWTLIRSRPTRILAFTAGEFDLTFIGDVTMPLLGQVKEQDPEAICKLAPTNVTVNLAVNRTSPPFDDPDLRKAMELALDRQSFIDIVTHGVGLISGAMLPPPEGAWGMPAEELNKLEAYAGTVDERRAKARQIMEAKGYGPNNKLKIKVSTRDFTAYKDPAVILVDQLNQIYFDAELEIVESSLYFGRMIKGNYQVALNLTGSSVDDPDAVLKANYLCGAQNNYTNYCNPEIDTLIHAQSRETDPVKRKAIVWDIERALIRDGARPMIYQGNVNTCWQPYLKGIVRKEDSIYNDWRFEQMWFDK